MFFVVHILSKILANWNLSKRIIPIFHSISIYIINHKVIFDYLFKSSYMPV